MTIQKHRETKTVTQVDVVVDSVTCDICGVAQPKAEPEYAGKVEWKTGASSYHVEETCVMHVHGDVYPEGGTKNYTILHICPGCFHEHILPLAKGNHTQEELDF